jgi:hypothetical protein
MVGIDDPEIGIERFLVPPGQAVWSNCQVI